MGSPTSGEEIEVGFDSPGTKTLTAKCGSEDPGVSVSIQVVEPTVYRAGFGGDHTLYATPSGYDGWADGTTEFTDPVYDTGKNNPVCVSKNSDSVSLAGVKLESTALSYLTCLRVDATGTEEWDESGDVSFTGTTCSEAGLAITGNIINEVHDYENNFQIQWKYRVPTGTNTTHTMNTTNHTVYVTFAAPDPGGAEFTEKRINWLCEAASGQTSEEGIADGIHFVLDNDPPEDMGGDTQSDDWELLSGSPYTGQCDEQARFMKRALQLLGLSEEDQLRAGKVFASKDAGESKCFEMEDSEVRNQETVWLIMDFNTGSGYNWQAYEGVCVVRDLSDYWWYAIIPSHKADHDYDMLVNKIKPQQYWVSTYEDKVPGEDEGWQVKTVYEEVELP